MKRACAALILCVIGISIVLVFAICWHSLEEIHYLKSFFPQQFTVEEAFYASAVELIKIIIISLPLLLVVAMGLWLVCEFRRNLKTKGQ